MTKDLFKAGFVIAITLLFSIPAYAEHFTGHEQLNVTNVTAGTRLNATPASINVAISVRNTSKAFIVFSQESGKTLNALSNLKANILNTTVAYFVKNLTGSIDFVYFVAEFDSGMIVRRGNLTVAAGTKTSLIDLQNRTNLSKAFIIFSNTANNSAGGVEDRFMFFANFTNETVMQFSRNDTQDKSDIEWQVVEFFDNSTVQAGTANMTDTSSRVLANINPVDLTRSFIVISWNASGTNGAESRYLVRASFVNSTQINLSRATGAVAQPPQAGDRIDISWFVITLNHTNASVQHVNTTQTGLQTNTTITEVNLSRAIIIGSYETSGGDFGDVMTKVNFTNSTRIQETTATTATPATARLSTWFIIEFPFTAPAPAPAPAAPTENVSSGFNIFGRSARFSFVSSILNKSNDTFGNTNDYAAAFDSAGLFAALVSNNAFGTRTDSNQTGIEWVLEARQPLGAKLFITFTKGNEQQMQRKIDTIKNFGLLDTRFGSYDIKIPEIVPLILRLEYDNIDIVGRAVIGPGPREIVIENVGRNANNVTKVKITVVR